MKNFSIKLGSDKKKNVFVFIPFHKIFALVIFGKGFKYTHLGFSFVTL